MRDLAGHGFQILRLRLSIGKEKSPAWKSCTISVMSSIDNTEFGMEFGFWNCKAHPGPKMECGMFYSSPDYDDQF